MLPGYTEESIGNVIAIEDYQLRFHIKGTNKEIDVWLPLTAVKVIESITEPICEPICQPILNNNNLLLNETSNIDSLKINHSNMISKLKKDILNPNLLKNKNKYTCKR